MGNRKIIQITSSGVGQYSSVLYALCDDGTVWQFEALRWNQIPSIPQ